MFTMKLHPETADLAPLSIGPANSFPGRRNGHGLLIFATHNFDAECDPRVGCDDLLEFGEQLDFFVIDGNNSIADLKSRSR